MLDIKYDSFIRTTDDHHEVLPSCRMAITEWLQHLLPPL